MARGGPESPQQPQPRAAAGQLLPADRRTELVPDGHLPGGGRAVETLRGSTVFRHGLRQSGPRLPALRRHEPASDALYDPA